MDRRRFITLAIAIPALVFLKSEQIKADQQVVDQRETLLQESPIAGFHYYDGELVFSDLYPGLELQLKRESGNARDTNAIKIHSPPGKLG